MLFSRQPILGLRASLLAVFAIVLMVADYHSNLIHRLRGDLEIAVTPFQYIVNWPVQVVESMSNDIVTRQQLVKDNIRLRAQVILLTASMQEMLAIKSENQQLHALLQSSTKIDGNVLEAQILAIAPDPFVHEVVIDKGKHQQIFVGQPVLDANGVMGQVIEVGVLSSRVLLITDPTSAIPVQDSRSGMRAIAVGDGVSGLLKLADVTQTANVQVGDILVTSGLGGNYPFGYPVGKITSVIHKPGDTFANITIQPSAQLNSSRLVLLIWPVLAPIDPDIKQHLNETPRNSSPIQDKNL